MRILMLTPYLPYPDSSGGQIRTLNLLKHLCHKHKITLVSLIKDDSEKKNIEPLRKYCHKVITFKRSKTPWTLKNILRTGFSLDPFLIVRNTAGGVKEAVRAELSAHKYDLIHAETFYVMPSIPETHVPIVMVDQTIEYLVYKHYTENTAHKLLWPLLMIDVLKMRYSERFYWRKADQVIAVSEADKTEMQKLEPDLPVRIVPNGVNLELFKTKKIYDNKKPLILFVSNFKWLQNIEAAIVLIRDVFPQVVKSVPGVKLMIHGQFIPDSIKSQASKSIIISEVAESDIAGLARGFGPETNATVFASTILGPGGTRLKNLAAMASGLPIVSTKVGIEGLNVTHDSEVLIGKNNKDIARLIVKVIRDTSLAKRLGQAARKHVESHYDWRKISTHLDEIYHDTIHKNAKK
jgi:polysaccharide biosynthesis protein PslH